MKKLLLLLIACSGAPRAEDPVWNKQPCDHCKMLVSDKRYAASSIDERGVRLFFDDIGCMAAYEAEHHAPKAHWVRDEVTGAWLDAQGAYFREGASTPMDYGFSGHQEGPGLSYNELSTRVRHVHSH